jgi:twitching motility protein PilT
VSAKGARPAGAHHAVNENESQETRSYRLDELLQFMVQQEASDLHLKPMRPPMLRLTGRLIPIKGPPLKPETLEGLLRDILSERQQQQLEQDLAVEFGYSLPGVSRFRGTIFFQRGTLGACFRRVPFAFPSLDDWGLPDVLKEIADCRTGIVLLTGPTGSGKSSTLAGVLRIIVENRLVHVVTIEDPIEFIIPDAKGAVTQREVGSDTPTFASALRNALRQDPDVIMVGENRDLETMSTTLTAAETGHLVLTTLHTNTASQTLDRIIDMFPGQQHAQVKQQLSETLKAVVSLKLVPRADGDGLVAAVEVLRDSPRVSKLIKEGNITELDEEIEKSVSYYRMQSMNQSLAALVINNTITRETALEASTNASDLDLMLRKFFFASGGGSEGETDMPSDADYSRVHKLLEIEKHYEDLKAQHDQDLQERDQELQRLRAELAQRQQEAGSWEQRIQQLEDEKERAARALESQRAESQATIERLQARVRELSNEPAGAAPQKGSGGGFFRR